MVILERPERRAYRTIKRIDEISGICEGKKEDWLGQLDETKHELSGLIADNGEPVLFTEREFICITVVGISYVNEQLREEIEKLQYKQSVSAQAAYTSLKELEIRAGEMQTLNLLQATLFLFLAKFVEDSVAEG